MDVVGRNIFAWRTRHAIFFRRFRDSISCNESPSVLLSLLLSFALTQREESIRTEWLTEGISANDVLRDG